MLLQTGILGERTFSYILIIIIIYNVVQDFMAGARMHIISIHHYYNNAYTSASYTDDDVLKKIYNR